MPGNPQTSRSSLQIAGTRIARGRTYDLEIAYSESYTGLAITVPVRVVAAPTQGPVVFLMGVVHGDELNGLGIIREIAFEHPLNLKSGTVIALPCVNVPGLENHSRYLPDRRDLNRSFPGSATGSLSSRLANVVYDEVVRKCDYGLDFHTAAVRRTNYPNIRADLSKPEVAKLARAFGVPLIVHNRGAEGSLRRVAVEAGIPTIVLEAGEVWKIEPGIVELGRQGAMNVFSMLGMTNEAPSKPPFLAEIRSSKWIRAERGGILKFHVVPGQAVRRGQVLATNLGILGQHQNEIVSPSEGFILGMTTMPAVKPGEPVFHLAIPSREMARQIRRKDDSFGNEPIDPELHRSLATNVLVRKVPNEKPSIPAPNPSTKTRS